ncbi:ABC transporter, partial [Rhodococcus erythropolis]
RLLDPQIDLVAAVRAEVPRLLTQVASPTAAAQAILSTTAVTTAVVRRLPGQLDQIATSIASGSFTLRTRSIAHPDDRRWLRRSANNALGMVAGVTALIVAVILLFVPGGPQLTPQLSAYALVSAVLGFVGVVLCMRTVFRLFTLDNR